MSQNLNQKYRLLNVHCSSCVVKLERLIKGVSWILEGQVNFPEKFITLETQAKEKQVLDYFKKNGFDLEPMELSDALIRGPSIHLLIRALLACFLGVFLMATHGLDVVPRIRTVNGDIYWGIIACITSIVMFYAGGQIYLSAFKAIRARYANMHVLIALGTLIAWVYSIVVLLFYHQIPEGARYIYFEAAVFILGFVNIGAYLDERAKSKASTAIQQLIGLRPKKACLLKSGEELEIPIEKIQVGDRLLVRPGEKVPADGVIAKGSSYLDESMITGEPVPLMKADGDRVFEGTINTTGAFELIVDKERHLSTLSQIIELVRNAQSSKPPIAEYADRIAAYFVPIVIIIALITALCWYYLGGSPGHVLTSAMSVLVIACPCAIGLAVPISTMVAIGMGAKHGLLIRSGTAMQVLSEVDIVFFDKTGTLTKGYPELVKIEKLENHDEKKLLQVVASIERRSEHPLGQCIVKKAHDLGIPLKEVEDFESITGRGVNAKIMGMDVLIGNERLMKEHQIPLSSSYSQGGNGTALFVAFDAICVAVLTLSDALKEDALITVSALQNLGMKVHMLTGDRSVSAQRVAKDLSLDAYQADLLPQDKLQMIQIAQKEGKKVAFVGDGINDAPALAQADVGIAMGSGTDVAIESAGLTVMGDSIKHVSKAFFLSKAVMKNIKQNLFGGFIYNILGIPIAAGVLYPWLGITLSPIIASIAMAASSLTVVINANRLQTIKLK